MFPKFYPLYSFWGISKKESIIFINRVGASFQAPRPLRLYVNNRVLTKKSYNGNMEKRDSEDIEDTEEGTPNTPAVQGDKEVYGVAYASDVVESFNAFIEYSKAFPIEIVQVDELSTREEVKSADAKMLHSLGGALALGLNRVRSIDDVSKMSTAVTKFMRERRVLLDHDSDNKEDFWKPL